MIKLLILSFTEILWLLSNMILKPRKLSCDKIYYNELARGKFDEKKYRDTKKTEFYIVSDYGYLISCELLENIQNQKKCSKKIAILCHGFSCAKYMSLIYAELFIKLGFDVMIYDHRNHGLSGKALTTMGHFEKYDLKKVVDWCYQKYGEDCQVVTHGESMGASTVLLHLGIDDRVKCAISDCGYSDLKQLLNHQLKIYYHLPLCLIPLESLITYLRAGFWYRDVSPISIISKVETPILFIHGKSDRFVPTSMSKQMYDAKKEKKALYLVGKAKHAESCIKNKEGYEERLRRFVHRYIKE